MEALQIFNTLVREKRTFIPRWPGEARMYVCGITVYDYCHVGHARMMVVFDIVQRWLRTIGYHVTYVRNITDIDDKIIRRALENGETIQSLTSRFIRAMNEDEERLGVERPDFEPLATEFIPQMLGMIETLEAKGYAYRAKDGDVNFSVRKFAGYGRLSGKSIEDLRAGERVTANEAKEDPLDFVLWKRAKMDEPNEARWDSGYGFGRPGWHITCSALSCSVLGEQFDIHGGGQDLQFPHHENEMAQSEAASGKDLANYWMHNGFVQVDNEKMSKSLGNFFTIREVLQKYDAEVVRFFIARTHYRSPLNYSDAHLDDARASLTRLYTSLKDVELDGAALDWNESYARRFHAAMNDDFNTPLAVSVLFELASEVNRTGDRVNARQLKRLAGTLGLLGRDAREFLQKAADASIEGAPDVRLIEEKIYARLTAKKAGNYVEADRIRLELLDTGVVLEDKPGGLTEWRYQ
jgi:cysteinyl-tRNA synthetase